MRAVSKALNTDWETAYFLMSDMGFFMGNIMNADSVWGAVLRQHGFYRENISNTCSDCYTADDFCKDHPEGVFVLGFGNHVATVIDGNLYDSWNSSFEIPQYFWKTKE